MASRWPPLFPRKEPALPLVNKAGRGAGAAIGPAAAPPCMEVRQGWGGYPFLPSSKSAFVAAALRTAPLS